MKYTPFDFWLLNFYFYTMLKALLLVGTGGFFGSIARYGVKLLTDKYLTSAFPYGTFLVNIVGCFIIGLLFGLTQRNQLDNTTWLILATGFCGGFTTFSSFALENNLLLGDKLPVMAITYTLLSLVLGIVLCRWGMMLTR